MDWLPGYSIVVTLLALLVAYELFALWARKWHDPAPWPTISEMVWRLNKRWPWLKWVGTAIGVLLILHFFWGWP